jgi:hypothetical protein
MMVSSVRPVNLSGFIASSCTAVSSMRPEKRSGRNCLGPSRGAAGSPAHGKGPANRSLNCVAGINRYTVSIGVLYAKQMMAEKRFIRDLSCLDSPTD